ncbi:hypothetical protein [Geodermatophilus sp. SYSU D01119]
MTRAARAADRRAPAAVLPLRVPGALLLAAAAAIHGWLWLQGYDGIPVIGPAFLADTVLGGLLALLVGLGPRRWLPWAAAAGALFALGTLGALLLSTTVGLFGFVETTAALLWWESFWVELAAVLVLAALAVSAAPSRSAGAAPARPAPTPAPGAGPPSAT